MTEQATSKKITVGLILSWIFGVLFALTGFIAVFSEPIPGIVMLIMGAVLLPPVNKFVDEKWKFHLSGGMKAVVLIIGFIIFGSTIDTSKQQNNQPPVHQEQPVLNTEQKKDEIIPTEEQPKATNNEKPVVNDSIKYEEILIPSSRAGDKGKYYLMKYETIGDNIKALNKRVGVDSIGYTITETNCKTMQMREFGYSEKSPSEIIEKPSEWYDLVSGSSKSDLAKFLCENYYKNEEKPKTTKEATVPVEYKSALNKAEMYAKTMQMSKQGVYDQLVSEYGEKFSADAAQYAINNMTADWNANALAKAKNYQNTMNMSPAAIRDQLISKYGEKYTKDEADYAIQHLND